MVNQIRYKHTLRHVTIISDGKDAAKTRLNILGLAKLTETVVELCRKSTSFFPSGSNIKFSKHTNMILGRQLKYKMGNPIGRKRTALTIKTSLEKLFTSLTLEKVSSVSREDIF